EASVALIAFGLAAAPTAEDVYTHIKSVDDVVHALGIDIPPVTGHLHALGQALAPQMLELYGGALNTLSQNGSVLAGIVGRITTGFDDWMAKLDLFMDKQSHTDGLVSAGGEVLAQMAVILDNLGVAFENLVKADPGTVHYLGDLLEGASKLVEVFTEIPAPILRTALAIHAFLLWGGLLGTGVASLLSPVRSLGLALGGVGKEASAVGQLGEEAGGLATLKATLADIGTGFSTFGSNVSQAAQRAGMVGSAAQASAVELKTMKAAEADAEDAGAGLLGKLGALATNPWTWAAVGTAALVALAVEFGRTKDATQQWIDTLNQGLGSGTWFNTLPNNMQAMTAVTAKLTTGQHQLSQAVTASQGSLGGISARFGGYSEAAQGAVIDTVRLGQSVSELTDEQSKLSTTQQAQIGFLTGLGKAYGTTLTDSMALATVAGVNLTQVTKKGSAAYLAAVQQVANLITGYKDMSVQGGILANSVNAVTFASEQQSSKITALTQGWSAFIGMVTGGMSSFSTFETQVAGLGTAATDLATITVSGGKASIRSAAAVSSSYTTTAMSASSANSAITTYTGYLIKGSKAQQQAANYQQKLTASLQVGGASATQAKTAVDAYTSSVTASGVGSAAQAGARAKLIADLSSTRTVARQAATAASSTGASLDGVNAASLQLQQTWVGAITDGSQMMNSLLMMASAAGLGAKGTTLLTQAGKDMVAQLLPMAQGSSDATAQLYALAQQAGYQGPDAFQSLVTWVGKTQNAEQNLQEITARLTVASADLSADVQNLAQALNQSLNQAMSAAIFQASGGQKAFNAFATAIMHDHGNLGLLKTSAAQVATEMINMTGSTVQAHQEFDTMAIAFGLSKTAADKLWASVVRLAQAESRIPAHVTSTITIQEILAGAVVGGGKTPSTGGMRVTQRAKGGPVRGGSGRPGADDIPALLSDDEYVISAPAVRRYGAGLFEGLNAMRYASGGHVGGGDGAAAPAGSSVVNRNVFNLTFEGQKPTDEEWYAIQLKLTSAIGSAPS
ncbi:MAG: hypothetical protein ACRDOU_05265, partial [Streptosporangiaceae bacterium]